MFHLLEVKEVKRETADTVSIAFNVPSNIESDFNFKAGQYLTLKRDINGEDVRRAYSLCSSPIEGEYRVAVKQVENGLFSTFANKELSAGDKLEVMAPMGNFCVDINASSSKNYLLIAAGSGITPIISIVKTVLAQEPNSKINLIYGNKSADSTIFKSQIDAISSENLTVHYVYSQQDGGAAKGRIDNSVCDNLVGSKMNEFNKLFVCGPEEMINSVSDYAANKGMAKENIHFELFTVPTASAEDKPMEGAVNSKVTVIVDGDEIEFELHTDGDTILDAAQVEGADVPFACKGGVCCTCRCKVEKGKAIMDANYALGEDEVEQGFILACQAHPVTEEIVVDFDVI